MSPGRPPHPLDRRIARRIREARKARGLSQKALAGRLGLSLRQLQNVERHGRVPAATVWRIARILRRPVGDLFDAGTFATIAPSRAALDEACDLACAFESIAEPAVREALLDLLRALGADAPGGGHDDAGDGGGQSAPSP